MKEKIKFANSNEESDDQTIEVKNINMIYDIIKKGYFVPQTNVYYWF